MSIVCFDGDTLAVDRASWKNQIWSPTRKLFKLSPPSQECLKRFRVSEYNDLIVWGACGYAEEIPLILEWMEKGGEAPSLKKQNVARGLILHAHSGYINGLTGLLTLEPFGTGVAVADGGGHEIALGAMLAGATAPKAVELAKSRSSWGAGGVDYYCWRTGESNLEGLKG